MIQAKVRSTIQRRRMTTQPAAPRGRLTISSATCVCRFRPVDQPAGAAVVGKDGLDEGEGATRQAKHALGAVAVLDVGGMDFDGQQPVVGVSQDVALASVDLLAGVEALESPF